MQHLFGHTAERRLGLRLPTHCWALLRSGQAGTYALAVELSATGVVLELAGRHERVEFHREQRFDLDLFIPGATTPIHVAVRPVRAVGARTSRPPARRAPSLVVPAPACAHRSSSGVARSGLEARALAGKVCRLPPPLTSNSAPGWS